MPKYIPTPEELGDDEQSEDMGKFCECGICGEPGVWMPDPYIEGLYDDIVLVPLCIDCAYEIAQDI